MPKWTRICSLNRAKVAMTTAATTTPVMARKTGSHRPGSVITSSVTKLVARKNGSIMGSAGQGPADAEPLCPTLLDKGTFIEMDKYARRRSPAFGQEKNRPYGD